MSQLAGTGRADGAGTGPGRSHSPSPGPVGTEAAAPASAPAAVPERLLPAAALQPGSFGGSLPGMRTRGRGDGRCCAQGVRWSRGCRGGAARHRREGCGRGRTGSAHRGLPAGPRSVSARVRPAAGEAVLRERRCRGDSRAPAASSHDPASAPGKHRPPGGPSTGPAPAQPPLPAAAAGPCAEPRGTPAPRRLQRQRPARR